MTDRNQIKFIQLKTYDETSAEAKLKSLTGWKFEKDGIEKKFIFKDFKEAISFMVSVGFVCEIKNHHPEWSNVYNKLHIRFSTHDAKGLTDKDFEMAGEVEKILNRK